LFLSEFGEISTHDNEDDDCKIKMEKEEHKTSLILLYKLICLSMYAICIAWLLLVVCIWLMIDDNDDVDLVFMLL
jgi:hypothetical protein